MLLEYYYYCFSASPDTNTNTNTDTDTDDFLKCNFPQIPEHLKHLNMFPSFSGTDATR